MFSSISEPRARRRFVVPAALLALAVVFSGGVVVSPAAAATANKTIRGYSNSTTITVPNGVTEMDIVLQGGNGGAGAREGNERAAAGKGTTVTIARIPVSAGQRVRLAGADDGSNSGGGGRGYVSGGNGGQGRVDHAGNGGGGGGAAAVEIDGVLIALAGGGGGSGGGTFDTYTSGHRGGPGGTDGPGSTPETPETAGAGGSMPASDITTPTAGGAGESPTGNLLSGAGGGGGGGAAGGTGGRAGYPGGGGGGGAGASAALTEYAGATLQPVFAPGTTSSGSVAITWRQAPTLTVETPALTYVGETARGHTDIAFPSGFRTGATYSVELEGHGSVSALSNYARTPWSFTNVKVGTWTVTVRAEPWDESMGAATATAQLVVVAGTTSAVTLRAGSTTATVGSPVTLTARPSLRTPNGKGIAPVTGTIQFFDGDTALGPARDVNIHAYDYTLNWTPQAAGDHSLTAVFTTGVAEVANAVSTALTITVARAPVDLVLNASTTARAGSPATLSARTGTQTPGTYRFVLGDGDDWTAEGSVASSSGAAVTWETPDLPEGVVTVDVTFTPADAAAHAVETQHASITVARGATTTQVTVASTAQAAVPLTVTARVSADEPDDTRPPIGTVTFIAGDGSRMTASPVRTGSGWAEYAVDVTPTAGPFEITALYGGSPQFRASQSTPATASILAWPTTATASLSSASVRVDEAATLQVQVVAGGVNPPPVSGAAQLLVDGSPSGPAVALSNGSAVLTVPAGLTLGEHTISVAFADASGTFTASSAPAVILTVTRIPVQVADPLRTSAPSAGDQAGGPVEGQDDAAPDGTTNAGGEAPASDADADALVQHGGAESTEGPDLPASLPWILGFVVIGATLGAVGAFGVRRILRRR